MRTWYRTCFHTLYDEKKYIKEVGFIHLSIRKTEHVRTKRNKILMNVIFLVKLGGPQFAHDCLRTIVYLLNLNLLYVVSLTRYCFAQSAGAVEYTDCISAEEYNNHPQ